MKRFHARQPVPAASSATAPRAAAPVPMPLPAPRQEPGYFLRRDSRAERAADAIAAGRETAPAEHASPARAPLSLGLGTGAPLADPLRSGLEQQMGADLAAIRIHHNSPVPARLGARALAAGHDIALGPDAGPGTLAHEVAHSLQQARHGPAIQLEDKPDAERKEKERTALDAVTDGIGVIAKELEKNKEFEKEVVEPVKAEAKRVWQGMPAAEQAGVATFGALTYTTMLGATLFNQQGRDLVSGLNLALPLRPVPYMPIERFVLQGPTSPGEPGGFQLSLGANDLLKLAAEETGWLPAIKFSLDLDFATPDTGGVKLKKGKAKIKPLSGIELQVGQGIGLPYQPMFADPHGGTARLIYSSPAHPGMEPPMGSGFMLNVDVAQLPFVPGPVRELFGGPPQLK